MKKYWIGFIMIVVATGLTGCSEKKDDVPLTSTQENIQAEPFVAENILTDTYENSTLGIQLKHPSDWSTQENPSNFVTFSLSNPTVSNASMQVGPYSYTDILADTDPEEMQLVVGLLYHNDILSLKRQTMTPEEKKQLKLQYTGDVEEHGIDGHLFKKYQFNITDRQDPPNILFNANFLIGNANDMDMFFYYEYAEDKEKNILESILAEVKFDANLTYTTYQNADLGITLEYPIAWEKEEQLETETGAIGVRFFNEESATDIVIGKTKGASDPKTQIEDLKLFSEQQIATIKSGYESVGCVVTMDDQDMVETVQIANTDFVRVQRKIYVENTEKGIRQTDINDYYSGIVNGDRYIFFISYKDDPTETARVKHLLNTLKINTEIQWKEDQSKEMGVKFSVPTNWQTEKKIEDNVSIFSAKINDSSFSIILSNNQKRSLGAEDLFAGLEKEAENRIQTVYKNAEGLSYEVTNEGETTLLISDQEFQQLLLNIHISTSTEDFIKKERTIIGKYQGKTYIMFANYDTNLEAVIDKIIQSIVFF